MPKIRPPRSAATSAPDPLIEDYVPPTGPVEIELLEDDLGPTEVSLAPAPVTPEPEPAPEPEADPLQKALEAQLRAEELQRVAEARAADSNRREQERSQELERERGSREDAQYNSVLTAIAAEQSALDKAEADYAAFSQMGDWGNASKAQRVMATAAARIDRLEDGKQSFETQRETRTVTPPTPASQAPLDFEQKMAQMPEQARGWLRKHPEFVNDNAMTAKIGAVHQYLTTLKSVPAFTPAYFDALDEEFGFKAAPAVPEPSPQPARRSTSVSAPVSRDVPTPSGQRASTGITLTEEERRIARTSFTATDMTDRQKEYLYAQNKRKLQTQRANGSYPSREQA